MDSTARILTNMTFGQSDLWSNHVVSIYDDIPTGSLSSWGEAYHLYRSAANFDVVVTMGARESLAYGLLCALTEQVSRQVMTEVFIDEPRPWNPLWRIKTALFRWVARRSIGILTNSSAEVDSIAKRFQIEQSRLRFVPLNSDLLPGSLPVRDDGFLLAAGRSRRDYATLLRAAASIQKPIVILCGAGDLAHKSLPPNVTVHRDVSRDRYLDFLRRCTITVLPLRPSLRSTGQVVMLEAMALGKPVVATRTSGVIDYLRDQENGLLVEPGDAAAMAAAVNKLLGDRKLSDELGHRGLNDVQRLYMPDTHAQAKMRAITELWRAATSP